MAEILLIFTSLRLCAISFEYCVLAPEPGISSMVVYVVVDAIRPSKIKFPGPWPRTSVPGPDVNRKRTICNTSRPLAETNRYPTTMANFAVAVVAVVARIVVSCCSTGRDM